jgi:hypothetical protein
MGNGQATWTVVGQRQTSQFQAGGTFVDGQLVTFETGNGHAGQVFIPSSQLANVDQVKATIQAKANALDAVGKLTSDELSNGASAAS